MTLEKSPVILASPAGVFRGDRISFLPTNVGREEIRSPLKTPAAEATVILVSQRNLTT